MPQLTHKPGTIPDAAEKARLDALHDLGILDTPPEPCFDAITRMAASCMKLDTAYLAFVDETRVWIKSKRPNEGKESPLNRSRHGSHYERIVLEGKPIIAIPHEDHPDIRPDSHPGASRKKPAHPRLFAGVPVRTASGHVVGALCVCGARSNYSVSDQELSLLEQLAALITDELELRDRRRTMPAISKNLKSNPESYPLYAGATAGSQDEGTPTLWPRHADMVHALNLNQFVLFYQPEVELTTRRIVGVEALVRWQHPQRGLVSPLDFIPQAEENGLILPLGDWGLGQACRQLQTWQKKWPRLSNLRVCVNLSARQFSRIGLADHVESLLLETGISANQLGLELTESSLISDATEAARVLTSLNRLGVSLHMDDFGTGYSSLSHLHLFPFDVLKIDRSFVQRMSAGQQSLQIVQTILELARVLGMDVVAEGIETEEQSKMLLELGCRYGQGYLFSPPLPATEIEALLAHPELPLHEEPRTPIAGQVLPEALPEAPAHAAS
ncbi:bifunctional diguanylate cyclase/phosphodiesterase [Acidicapsa acidisoli]|uniref:bifunctional diguanylate cyclase/phosphodiesterase n=1 Tax=Acidicapsa acidisoli TaxID=1615681 RepID=UPI0021DF5948|nr:EAL domain-containing protein [Acidicapsa acidisoli]